MEESITVTEMTSTKRMINNLGNGLLEVQQIPITSKLNSGKCGRLTLKCERKYATLYLFEGDIRSQIFFV